MDGKDSESLGAIKKMDEQDAESSNDNECAAKDAPLSGDDQKSSDDDSKVKERTRITSSSLLSNSFSTSET